MVRLKERRISLDLDDDSTVKWEDAGRRYCLHIQRDDQAEDPREEMDLVDIMACWHGRYRLGDRLDDAGPEAFWRRLVRENVPAGEIFTAAEAGKLDGIRLAPNEEHPEDMDVYETYYLRTVLGNTAPSECLEYEGISKDAVAGYIMDDLTVGHCMTLLRPYAEWLPLWLYEHSGITMSCGERTYPYDDAWDSMQVGWIIAFKETVLSELRVGEDAWRERAIACMEASVKMYDQYLTGDVYGFTLYRDENTDADNDPDWTEEDSCWGFYDSDVMESGLAEQVGHGLMEAIQGDRYEVGRAILKTVRYYTF